MQAHDLPLQYMHTCAKIIYSLHVCTQSAQGLCVKHPILHINAHNPTMEYTIAFLRTDAPNPPVEYMRRNSTRHE